MIQTAISGCVGGYDPRYREAAPLPKVVKFKSEGRKITIRHLERAHNRGDRGTLSEAQVIHVAAGNREFVLAVTVIHTEKKIDGEILPVKIPLAGRSGLMKSMSRSRMASLGCDIIP